MKSTTLFLSLLSVFFTASAASSHHQHRAARASCSNGRTAKSAQCCVWYDVLDDLQANLFEGGQCLEDAHDALRLSFHDAIGYSPALKSRGQFPGGGADGSIIAFSDVELTYGANDGLDEIVDDERKLADKYGVSYGDMIQFAAAVSVRNCPGGPLIPFLAGRPHAIKPAPEGLVPEAFDSVTKMINRVNDAGLTADELVDLLASHSIGQQETVNPSIKGTPFDSTPSVLDTNFFLETMLRGTLWPGDGPHKGEVRAPFIGRFRLQSDWALARDPRTSCRWQGYINDQPTMSSRFGVAMAKMALLGQKSSILTDCSEVIPPPTETAPKKAKLPEGKTVMDLELNHFCRNPGSGFSLPGGFNLGSLADVDLKHLPDAIAKLLHL
ncbi:Peroxidase [Mycena kentingensis (nom. inval.)]|nr:Peroxidase [Mycena kentingensis (nom. inval.)]